MLHVLCVDSDPDIRAIVEMSLRLDPGISVQQADGATTALDLIRAKQSPIDAILMDDRFFGMPCHELLPAIRLIEGFDTTPIIFLTANVTPSDELRFERLGAVGMISKPFDPLELANQLKITIKRSPSRPSAQTVGLALTS